VAKLCWWID